MPGSPRPVPTPQPLGAGCARCPPAARCISSPGLASQPGSAPSPLLNPSPGAARISSSPGRSPGAGKNITNKPRASKSSRVPSGEILGGFRATQERPRERGWRLLRPPGAASPCWMEDPGGFLLGMGQKITAEPQDAAPHRLGDAGGAAGGLQAAGRGSLPQGPIAPCWDQGCSAPWV